MYWDKHNACLKYDSILARLEQANKGKITLVGCSLSHKIESMSILLWKLCNIPQQKDSIT
jgi:hypothetical protein